ncbi:flagellar brake protein [Paenibacillus chartarius]|uniref:Flagellar brake protein n=1 Tax=Paenibacillus chartarius TaxID=747481 RepID=A0ABV6DQF0_9BACL
MLPKISQVLFLQVNSIDEEEAKIEYKSRIADMNDSTITIEVPLDEKTGRLKRLYQGDEINAYYLTDGGVKNYFSSSVVGFTEDTVRLIQIKKPEADAITRVQRRSFLRVPAELEIAVKYTEQLQFVALTEDVGGGGISFICDGYIPLASSAPVSCWLLIPYKNGSIEHVPFKGEIVRVKQLETGKQLAMTRFIDITDRERQKIIRYCFERQMDFRKR